MTELKPCPFCGGQAKLYKGNLTAYYYVKCNRCGARILSRRTKESAIRFWNRSSRDDRNKRKRGQKMNDEQWLYSSMDEIIDSTE